MNIVLDLSTEPTSCQRDSRLSGAANKPSWAPAAAPSAAAGPRARAALLCRPQAAGRSLCGSFSRSISRIPRLVLGHLHVNSCFSLRPADTGWRGAGLALPLLCDGSGACQAPGVCPHGEGGDGGRERRPVGQAEGPPAAVDGRLPIQPFLGLISVTPVCFPHSGDTRVPGATPTSPDRYDAFFRVQVSPEAVFCINSRVYRWGGARRAESVILSGLEVLMAYIYICLRFFLH